MDHKKLTTKTEMKYVPPTMNNCMGHIGRMECEDCRACGMNHSMSFEYFRKLVTHVIEKHINNIATAHDLKGCKQKIFEDLRL